MPTKKSPAEEFKQDKEMPPEEQPSTVDLNNNITVPREKETENRMEQKRKTREVIEVKEDQEKIKKYGRTDKKEETTPTKYLRFIKKVQYEDKGLCEVEWLEVGNVIPAPNVEKLTKIPPERFVDEGEAVWCNRKGEPRETFDEKVQRIMKEEGVDRENAWRITKNREEKKIIETARKGDGEKLTRKEIVPTEHLELCKKWARVYYNLGINVIPIKYKSKAPNGFKKGEIEKWHYKRIPKDIFEGWICSNKFENIAILGGHSSQDLICNDFDNPEDFKKLDMSVKKLVDDGAWITETPKEPGRYHIVLRDKEEVKTTRKGKHIDYRANEHYWLVYPSIHPNGKIYNFLNTHDPDKLELPRAVNTLAIFEKWNDKLNQLKGTKKEIKETVKTKEIFDEGPDCIRNAWLMGAEIGERYNTAGALGSYLQQQKIPMELAQDIVIKWFTTKCNTETRPVKDIKRAVKLVYKKRKYAMGCRYWREKTKFCPYEKEKDCKFYNPEKARIIEIKGDIEEVKEKIEEVEKAEEEKNIKFHNGFIGIIEEYFNKRTNAPIQFATHLGIQIIGFAMGVDCVHMIQPKPLHHNIYNCLLGISTLTRKTTAQDMAIDLILNTNYLLPSGFSPQGLLKELSESPRGYLPMGEFSSVLRGIKKGTGMADLKEILNELHRCPSEYRKKLVKMNDSFTIYDPYLSASTTCTEEEFFPNLTEEIVYGGFCPRFIFVKGNSSYRPRNKLPAETIDIQKKIRAVLYKIDELIAQPKKDTAGKMEVIFEFTEDGLEEFNRIDKMLTLDPYWENVKPFVGRILDYLIVYSDIIQLSNIIGAVGIDQFRNLTKLINLTNFTNFTQLNTTSPNASPVDVNSAKLVKEVNLVKLVNFINVTEEKTCFQVHKPVVNEAWGILKPCLEYTKEIVRHYNEDVKVGGLLMVLEKHAPISRSKALRYTHLPKKDFDEGIDTLMAREVAFVLVIASDSLGRGKPRKLFYCLRENINSIKCKKCKIKCKLDQRYPKLEGFK